MAPSPTIRRQRCGTSLGLHTLSARTHKEFAYTVTAADTGDGDVPVGDVRIGAGGIHLGGGIIRAASSALTDAAAGELSFRVTLAPAADAPVTVD